ncbi:MAG: hypothetical protein IPH04_20575 [Saprospirales bacterium]|nr:hypothetical protein [Saprospirales bacterium]MBK6905127.1 hypothetical protein [Saprospirales bacterium]MBK7335211.1 hypothetical protein [Saprospirales bacterium]
MKKSINVYLYDGNCSVGNFLCSDTPEKFDSTPISSIDAPALVATHFAIPDLSDPATGRA